ncbi:phosphoglucosamine mutase [Mucilaginibacter sp. X5P1]|uniref:phosphoglucosamine mutase n=1 Tax=Mucilaginibacter sp. X5P1 TaxID=2723088 RepID=UPI00160AC0F4|nr:phosphoglucosamine mutase [Mucilaginibacter sp. X5P1]MBB6141670.1 phosphomannomutase [Mucilaginibacter sp. X5P1]
MTLIKSISGIRGTIGGYEGFGFTPADIMKYSTAFGTWIINKTGNKKIVIGRDARLSGEMVRNLVIGSLQSIGIDVIDIGISTTPTVEMAVTHEMAGGGIILTASHNPKEWNALKLLNAKGEFISEEDGKEVLEIASSDSIDFAQVNELGKVKFSDAYLDFHTGKILALSLVKNEIIKDLKLKIVVDCINSSGAIFVPYLLKKLGIYNFILINEIPDGNFAHNPEPLPEHLIDLSAAVLMNKADLGIAVDPDVDRLCFVCEDGSMFGEEYTLVAVADYVLKNSKGNTVSNLSSTRALKEVTETSGSKYYASAVGEVNVVTKMKEVNAVIGGEGNGGIIYPELHYGRDALVGIALFLSHLADSKLPLSQLRAKYPTYHMAKSKVNLTDDLDVKVLLEYIKNRYDEYPQNTIDGLKIEFEKGWVHLRQSNTEAIIRVYSEGQSIIIAKELADSVISNILEFTKELKS